MPRAAQQGLTPQTRGRHERTLRNLARETRRRAGWAEMPIALLFPTYIDAMYPQRRFHVGPHLWVQAMPGVPEDGHASCPGHGRFEKLQPLRI